MELLYGGYSIAVAFISLASSRPPRKQHRLIAMARIDQESNADLCSGAALVLCNTQPLQQHGHVHIHTIRGDRLGETASFTTARRSIGVELRKGVLYIASTWGSN
jgi:hypothetical protein